MKNNFLMKYLNYYWSWRTLTDLRRTQPYASLACRRDHLKCKNTKFMGEFYLVDPCSPWCRRKTKKSWKTHLRKEFASNKSASSMVAGGMGGKGWPLVLTASSHSWVVHNSPCRDCADGNSSAPPPPFMTSWTSWMEDFFFGGFDSICFGFSAF